MPEPVAAWWARRQRSKGTEVPYEVGRYRVEWQAFPVLVRQYHPDLNDGVTLTQVPPAAEVFLQWQCDAGHIFVATPSEQRSRPGGARRRSVWCPECTAGAVPVVPRVARPLPSEARRRPVRTRRVGSTIEEFAVGDAFWSPHAPRVASAAEADLRQRLERMLDLDLSPNAVRVRRPFFDRLEVWPDIVIPDLRVALEYDTTGRIGTEHVGPRETSDRAKDRLLRQAGW
ncbi:MAG: hypothetical protein RI885_2731, partial [Actinomycetota bacterium]